MVNGVASLDGVTGLGSLDDPMRQRLYGYVAEQDGPVTREQAATAMGIGRTLAAYHLDRLVTAGLLTISHARPEGKGGPGAGRPAKLYRLAEREVTVSAPPRAYELLARLLIESVERDASGAVRDVVHQAAQDTGRQLGAEVPAEGGDTLLAALRACGYQPRTDPADGAVELRNCPFHQLAQQHRDLVCGLNLSLVEGVIAGNGCPAHATLEPRQGRCCVVLRGAAVGPDPVDE